jgi:hypothetical protein
MEHIVAAAGHESDAEVLRQRPTAPQTIRWRIPPLLSLVSCAAAGSASPPDVVSFTIGDEVDGLTPEQVLATENATLQCRRAAEKR